MATILPIGNKWQARIRKKGMGSVSANFDTRAQAKAWAINTESDMLKNRHKDQRATKGLTLATVIDLYFKKEPSTRLYGKNKVAVLNRLKNTLGDVLISALDVDRLTSFIDMRLDGGAGGVTIGMDIAQISALLNFGSKKFKFAAENEIFDDVYDYMDSLGLDTKSTERNRRPTDNELAMIKKHFEAKDRQEIPMSSIIDFAVATTMRASEITRILWTDVDFEKRTVIIRDRKHPKRKKGNDQTVPLLADAWAIVLAQPRTHDQVFPYDAKTFSTIFPRARKACGIVDLRFHDLRHEGTSRLFEMGYDIPQVALFTGHTDWKMLKRYVQLRPEDLHPDEDGNIRLVRERKKYVAPVALADAALA